MKARKVIEEAGLGLLSTLRAKVALSTKLDLAHDVRDEAWAALEACCVGDLRRHLTASDQVLYASAADAAETRLLVRTLRLQARALDERIEALSRADDADTVDALAQGIEALAATHLDAERTVLLQLDPVLQGRVKLTTRPWAADARAESGGRWR